MKFVQRDLVIAIDIWHNFTIYVEVLEEMMRGELAVTNEVAQEAVGWWMLTPEFLANMRFLSGMMAVLQRSPIPTGHPEVNYLSMYMSGSFSLDSQNEAALSWGYLIILHFRCDEYLVLVEDVKEAVKGIDLVSPFPAAQSCFEEYFNVLASTHASDLERPPGVPGLGVTLTSNTRYCCLSGMTTTPS
eukprot:sb/3471273/